MGKGKDPERASSSFGTSFPGRAPADYGNIFDRYQQFADTGGYSPGDISALRSRAVSPIRSVYSDVNRDIDRSRSLQGDYAPGYAATKAKVGREQAYSVADATTNVEGMLAQMIQQGKLAGLGGMTSIFGARPGMAVQSGSSIGGEQQKTPWWKTALGVGGTALTAFSDKDIKKNIRPIKKGSILFKLKKLPISTWNYRDDPEGKVHIGPMAQDFHELFGGRSDKSIDLVDVMGVTLGAAKELAEKHGS